MQTLTPASDLATKIGVAIEDSPYLSNYGVDVETDDGRIVLRGKVQSYYQKQMAQETLLRVDGVQRVENHLVVAR